MEEAQRGHSRSWMSEQVFSALKEDFAKGKCNATELLYHLSLKGPASNYYLRLCHQNCINPPSEREALALYLLNKGVIIEHSEEEQHLGLLYAASCGNICLVMILCKEHCNIEATENK